VVPAAFSAVLPVLVARGALDSPEAAAVTVQMVTTAVAAAAPVGTPEREARGAVTAPWAVTPEQAAAVAAGLLACLPQVRRPTAEVAAAVWGYWGKVRAALQVVLPTALAVVVDLLAATAYQRQSAHPGTSQT
jgi:hypothetical protein